MLARRHALLRQPRPRRVHARGLKILLPQWRHPDAPLHALYHRNRFMAPRVRVRPNFLSERFAQVPDELERLLGLPPEPPRAVAVDKTAIREGL